MNQSNLRQRAFADAIQWAPTLLCSEAIGWGARRGIPKILRQPIYSVFSKAVGAKLSEVELSLESYPTFGDFFARRLKDKLRPFNPSKFCSPCDGLVAELGQLDETIYAKGSGFTLNALLASDSASKRLKGGTFSTIYLSPKDYHRVHVPLTAKLIEIRFVPGRLFPVRPSLTKAIDEIFSQNERVVFDFESEAGPFSLVMVGAMGVGNICVTHSGDESRILRKTRQVATLPMTSPLLLNAGDELGAFYLGSTVIICAAESVLDWDPSMVTGCSVITGEAIAEKKRPAT